MYSFYEKERKTRDKKFLLQEGRRRNEMKRNERVLCLEIERERQVFTPQFSESFFLSFYLSFASIFFWYIGGKNVCRPLVVNLFFAENIFARSHLKNVPLE
jgi:hypothetical protein